MKGTLFILGASMTLISSPDKDIALKKSQTHISHKNTETTILKILTNRVQQYIKRPRDLSQENKDILTLENQHNLCHIKRRKENI